ncbi:MAG TPA: DUF2934 domain-containing protein [Terriglobia bacterium]|nr:DUF2934 domain-containing protein [Terriglobia bacterium]
MSGKEERIRELAHAIWLEEGRPDGRAEQHWERARRQIEAQEMQDGGGSVSRETADQPVREAADERRKPAEVRRKAAASPARRSAGNGKAAKTKPGGESRT